MSALASLRKALRSGLATVFPPLRVEGEAVEMNLGSSATPSWAPLSEEMAENLCGQLHLGAAPPPLVPRGAAASVRKAGPIVHIDATELATALAEILAPLLTRKVVRTVERDSHGLITRILESPE